MAILLYSHDKKEAEKRIQEILKGLIPKKSLEIHRTIDGLSQRLIIPTIGESILVLLPADKKDLSNLLSIRDQFLDLRIILVLPDRERKTISMGCKLYPRFLSYADDDFKNVGAVLKKMATITNSNNVFLFQ